MINLNKKLIKGRIPPQINIGWVILLSLSFLAGSCQTKKVIYTPQGYIITKPDKTDLGTKLREISGIFWLDDNKMISNNDESGKIFFINLNDKKDFSYPVVVFGEKQDYEDIVSVDSSAYLLISNGQIVEVKGYARGGDVPGVIIGSIGGTNNEFETMYYDKEISSLIILCKSCHKEKNQIRTAYRFDLATKKLVDTPYYRIDINAIRQKLDDPRAEFFPSAAAVHPIQNKVYIVSSIGKLLVITDKKGTVERAIPLSPTMFPQPEGITFGSNGDMYISNEGADDRATLLKFVYKP